MVTIPGPQRGGRLVPIQAKPGASGGMFDRAGVDISMMQRAVPTTARVLAAGRAAGVKVIYLKMGFKPDLSDLALKTLPTGSDT